MSLPTRTYLHHNAPITIIGDITDEEIAIYLTQIETKKNNRITSAILTVDGDYINLQYKLRPIPFERIRRITGYLVGTTDRWGDAKRAELKDRVIHNRQE